MAPSFWNYVGSAVLLAAYLWAVAVATKRLIRPTTPSDWIFGGLLVAIWGGVTAFLVFLAWYWVAYGLGSVFA